MGLKLPDILLIHFLLPHATAPHFLETTSLVAGLTLPLVTRRLPIITTSIFVDPHLRLGIRKPYFFEHSLSPPALHYSWLAPRLSLCLALLPLCIMIIILLTVKAANPNFFEHSLSPPALHYSWLALRLPTITSCIFIDPHLRLGRRKHYFFEPSSLRHRSHTTAG